MTKILILTFLLINSFSLLANSKVTISKAVSIGMKHNLEIKRSLINTELSENAYERINKEYSPKINLTFGVGPINKAYGNPINSEALEVTDYKNWGILAMAELDAIIPVYSFGQKESYTKAAFAGKLIAKEKIKQKKDEIRFKIKEMYYGNLLALSSLEFIKGAESDVDGALKKLKKSKKTDKSDLYRLNIFKNQLLIKKQDIETKYKLSLKALSYYIGQKDLIPVEEWLAINKRKLQPLSYYINKQKNNRPELLQLKYGANAKKHLANASDTLKHPLLGIMTKYSYSYTDARDKQESVYAYDPYNQNSLIIGIGLKWNIDFGLAKNKGEKLFIESKLLTMQKSQAELGLELELKKIWEEIFQLDQIIKQHKKTKKLGKRWLNRAMMGGLLGLLDGKEIVQAYQARAQTYKDYLEAVYHYNIAWASLSRSIGQEVDPEIKDL